MPDALSKTIPIWCAVINRLLFDNSELCLPEEYLGASEMAHIRGRIDGWVKDAELLRLDVQDLQKKLSKPLRPLWVMPGTPPDLLPSRSDSFYPVVCCTASLRVRGSEESEKGYIQGAADDSESWAQGLTPQLFWQHKDSLMSTTEEDLPALVHKLSSNSPFVPRDTVTLVRPTQSICIGTCDAVQVAAYDGIIMCTDHHDAKPSAAQPVEPRKILYLACGSGKLGSRALRSQLQRIPLSSPPLAQAPTLPSFSPRVRLARICLQGWLWPSFACTTTTMVSPSH